MPCNGLSGSSCFCSIDDPWRVFFTTDHPNGAPFTAYPDLFALLMDKDLRAEWLARIPAEAVAMTTVPSLHREYTLYEIATMTRAAPARLLGALGSRPSRRRRPRRHRALSPGTGSRRRCSGRRPASTRTAIWSCATGRSRTIGSAARYRSLPRSMPACERRMGRYYDERYGLRPDFMRVPEGAIPRPEPFESSRMLRLTSTGVRDRRHLRRSFRHARRRRSSSRRRRALGAASRRRP